VAALVCWLGSLYAGDRWWRKLYNWVNTSRRS